MHVDYSSLGAYIHWALIFVWYVADMGAYIHRVPILYGCLYGMHKINVIAYHYSHRYACDVHTILQLGHALHQMITSSEIFITMATLSKKGPLLSAELRQLSYGEDTFNQE